MTFDGTNYTTTNGTVVLPILTNTTSLWNITYYSNESGGYFSRSYADINLSTTHTGSLHQAEVTFNAIKVVSGAAVTGFTVNTSSNGGSASVADGVAMNLTAADGYTFEFSKTGYYAAFLTGENVSALEQSTKTFTVHDAILNITVVDGVNNATISNFSGWVYSYNYSSFNQTFSTTSGVASLNVTPGSYFVYVEADEYAIDDDTNWQNVTISGNFTQANFTLYPDPSSVRVTVYDADTGGLLNDRNVTMVVSGSSSEDTYTLTDGTYYLGNLTADTYSFKFEAENYSQRVYVISVGVLTTQTLDAYLTESTDTVTFTILDDSTDAQIEGASIVMQRFVNGSLVTVESKFSDIVGQAQFLYVQDLKYIFTVTKANYTSKQFTLDPILSAAYTVRMTPTITLENTQQGSGYSIAYTPKKFTDGESYNLSWTILSPSGVLESYNITVCAPGAGCVSDSGTNANGGTLTAPFTITGADFDSRVTVAYTVDTTTAAPVTRTDAYPIILSTYGNQTWTEKDCPDYGLGTFDCALLGTGMVLVGAGGVAYFAGAIVAAPVAMLLIGVGYLLEFFTLWSIIVPLVLAFVIIVYRGSS